MGLTSFWWGWYDSKRKIIRFFDVQTPFRDLVASQVPVFSAVLSVYVCFSRKKMRESNPAETVTVYKIFVCAPIPTNKKSFGSRSAGSCGRSSVLFADFISAEIRPDCWRLSGSSQINVLFCVKTWLFCWTGSCRWVNSLETFSENLECNLKLLTGRRVAVAKP